MDAVMHLSKPASDVEVSVESFTNLFVHAYQPLKIDTYQRDFVWGEQKIEQLLADLKHHEDEATFSTAYYMGTVLLHDVTPDNSPDKESGLYVIDGQQRLTALCVLHHQLRGHLPLHCDLRYGEASKQRICQAASTMSDSERRPSADIFDSVVFTVVRVTSADMAFTFFDTQNNRGVPLHASDLLKAFHLRALHTAGNNPETLQRHCALRWETIQQGHPVLSHSNQLTHTLFQTFLWRARRWTGRQANFATHDGLLDEFQHRTLANDKNGLNCIPLYRSRHNRLANQLTLSPAGQAALSGGSVALDANAAALPFSIRQPVQEGLGFFLYADKYASLLQWLVHETPCSHQLEHFRRIDNHLIKANSLYLREAFLICALVYADQFGDERLMEFGLWLEHALGCIRLIKKQVRSERAQIFITQRETDARSNILDVIANAFTPEQVVSCLKTIALKMDAETFSSDEKPPAGGTEGVQGTYRQAVRAYFDQQDDAPLTNKHKWIINKIADHD